MASQTVLLLAAVLLPLAASAPATGEPFTLMDFVEGKFTTRTFKGTWISDNELRFYNSTTRELMKFDVEQGILTLLVPKEILNKYNDSAIDSFSKDGNLVAIAYETVHIYRHSTTSKFVVYDIQSGKEYKVAGEQQLRTLVWAGPRAGQRGLLWVNQQNNVYYRRDVTSATSGDIRITTTGEDGVIFNGIPDWVYEEEVLASGSAIWPSPDGTKVAFASFNDKLVNRAFYFKYGSPTGSYPPQQYPQLVNISYPKAGTPNPEVHLYVVDLEAVVSPTDVKLVPIEAPTEVTRDHILYGCFWTESKLLASWTNRVQNLNVLSSCSMDGKCVEALSQSEVAGWVDPPTLMMHSGGRRAAAILPSEDRANLAVITFPSASESGQATWTFLTSGNGNVIQVLDWDEKRDVLYYLQTTPEDPAKRHVYKVVVPGAGNNMLATSPQCLTCNIKTPEGNLCSYATATFSKDFKYSVVSCLGPDPAFHDIYLLTEKEPELKRTWDHNEEVRVLLRNKLRPEYLDDWYSITVDMRARVRLLLPPGMDKSGKTKYPLLVYVYAGPDSNQVSTAFSVTFGDYLCTSRNIVYALIDGRGSGNNGRKLMHSVYRRLGGVEIQDQISVARKLLQKLPYLDPQRTAIWGWSYGGFSTAHAMAKDTGGVFCCGVSVAPVTSFIYYDTIYTERYMGLPTEADNLYGYNLTDVTRVVENFRNKKYLLIHGNADDNVHYQQSMELSRALEEKDIMFQQQSYPDEAHSLAGVKKHVYHTMDDFWTRAFHLPKPQWANKAL